PFFVFAGERLILLPHLMFLRARHPRGNYVGKCGSRVLDRPASRAISSCACVRRTVMSEKTAQGAGPVLFSEKLASSQAFAGLFKEGMALVEETASYLDG